jgi:hypothetical protein
MRRRLKESGGKGFGHLMTGMPAPSQPSRLLLLHSSDATVPLRTHAATRSKSDLSASLYCRVLSLLELGLSHESWAFSRPSNRLHTTSPKDLSYHWDRKVASIHVGQSVL